MVPRRTLTPTPRPLLLPQARLNEIVTRAPQISLALSTLTAERLRPVACMYPPVN